MKRVWYFWRRLCNSFFSLLLRAQGARVGRDVWFEGPLEIRIDAGGELIIGDGCNFGRYALLKVVSGARLELKERVKINRFCIVEAYRSVTVEADVMTGPSVFITDGNHNFRTDRPTKEADVLIGYESKPVRIGAHAWIGSGVQVLPGVAIGAHAVIGAGSVVTKPMPSHAIAVGVPCRVIQYRTQVTDAALHAPEAQTVHSTKDVAA